MIDELKAAASILKVVTDAEPLVASLLSAVIHGDPEAHATVAQILSEQSASEAAAKKIDSKK